MFCIVLCKKWCLDIIKFWHYVKVHVFRVIVRAVNLIGGLSCDVSTVCVRGLPVLWHGWAYIGAWSWTGWEGRCPERRHFPSTRSSGLDKSQSGKKFVRIIQICQGPNIFLKCNALYLFNSQVPISKLSSFYTGYVIIIIYYNDYFQKEPNKVTVAPHILVFPKLLPSIIGINRLNIESHHQHTLIVCAFLILVFRCLQRVQ